MNIFGKTIHDYKHLQELKTQGMLDSHLTGAKQLGKPLNFNALDHRMVNDASPAQAFGFMTNNLQAISTEIAETLYLKYRLNELVPIKPNVPEGATSYAYRKRNAYGKAGFIDNRGTNAGSVDVSYDLISSVILGGGIDAEWSDQDVRSAMFGGTPLETDLLNAGTVSCLNHIEQVGLLGDSTKGFTGLINNADVTKRQETTANQITTVSDAAAYINAQISAIVETTNTIFGTNITEGLTIYLPVKQYLFLATTKYSTNAQVSIMDYLTKFNGWTAMTGNPIVFKQVNELSGAGLLVDDTTVADRMVIGFNNADVMEMANPIAPRITRIYDMPRTFIAPFEYSISQLNFKHPKACLYVDGV